MLTHQAGPRCSGTAGGPFRPMGGALPLPVEIKRCSLYRQGCPIKTACPPALSSSPRAPGVDRGVSASKDNCLFSSIVKKTVETKVSIAAAMIA